MTVHQLDAPCWVIRPRPYLEDDNHYGTRAKALAVIREAWDEDHWRPVPLWTWWRTLRYRLSRLRPGAPRPRQETGRCWIVQCDECETVIDEDDEGYVVHHGTRAEAEETVAEWEWVYSADGCLVFCPEDAPEDGQEPPLSPAEQEAAGQLVIPGVIP